MVGNGGNGWAGCAARGACPRCSVRSLAGRSLCREGGAEGGSERITKLSQCDADLFCWLGTDATQVCKEGEISLVVKQSEEQDAVEYLTTGKKED